MLSITPVTGGIDVIVFHVGTYPRILYLNMVYMLMLTVYTQLIELGTRCFHTKHVS